MNTAIKACLLLPIAAVACHSRAPSGAASGTSAQRTDGGPDRIKIDPQLIESGRVKSEPVVVRALSPQLAVAGEVRSSESGSAEAGTLVAGRVATLEVSEGANVKRGQVLAWVDAPEVARAAADLLLARAHAAVAAHKRARQELLDAASATSKNALDDARADDEAARAELLAARTLLTSLGGAEPPADPNVTSLIVRVPVRAPIAGVVAERNVVLGGAVAPDKALFRIVSDSRSSFSITARVPETVPAKPTAGASAAVTARGDGSKTCTAIVDGSLGGIDSQTRTLALRLTPDQGCNWLIPGSFVDVVFGAATPQHQLPGALVPRNAVIDVHGESTVFVAGAIPGEFSARTVKVGAGDATQLSIDSGVSAGDSVVVEGAILLKGELLRAELEGT